MIRVKEGQSQGIFNFRFIYQTVPFRPEYLCPDYFFPGRDIQQITLIHIVVFGPVQYKIFFPAMGFIAKKLSPFWDTVVSQTMEHVLL